MISPVCRSFGDFPSFHANFVNLVNQRTPSLFNAFNISGRISSSSAAFPDFNPRIAAVTSANVKTSSFPKSIVSNVLVGFALTRFQGRNQKNNNGRPKIS